MAAIILGPLNAAAIGRQLERIISGAGFDPMLAALFSSANEPEQCRLVAEFLYDADQPLWVRASKPIPPWWIGRGGRHNGHFTFDDECEAFVDLEARADRGERIDLTAMSVILSQRAGATIPLMTIPRMLMRQGFARLGLKPFWSYRAEAAERRLGHLRQLARSLEKGSAAPNAQDAGDDGHSSAEVTVTPPTPAPASEAVGIGA